MSRTCNKIGSTSLGKSGIQVPALAFGTLTMGPLQRALSYESGARLLIYACEKYGIDFVDTAQLYETYPYIRRAIAEVPLKVQTKAYAWDEATAEEAFTKAVRGIGRDYIDVFMLHEQESLYTLRGHEKAMEYLTKKKEEGYIGAVGVSTHFIDCVRACARNPYVDIVFAIYNQAGIGIADGSREEMAEALGGIRAAGKGTECMKALGGGHLISSRKEAIRHCMDVDLFDTIVIGMQDPEEIDYCASLFLGMDPDEELARRKDRQLLIEEWCEGCGKCVQRCRQHALTLRDGKACVDRDKCALCGYCATVCPNFYIKVI